MKAFILAAGEGKRLRPFTEKIPKPMISIAGKPILQHNIEFLAHWGIFEIAINLHHCPEVIENYFGNGAKFGVNITYSYEPELLGTAGAVKKLEKFMGERFLVVYGDNLINFNLSFLLSFHEIHKGIGTVVLHYRDDISQSGVAVLDDNERITKFLEKPDPRQTNSHWVNAGVLLLERDVFQYIPANRRCDFGRDVLPDLLSRNEKLYGYKLKQGEEIYWIDRIEDYERVHALLSRNSVIKHH